MHGANGLGMLILQMHKPNDGYDGALCVCHMRPCLTLIRVPWYHRKGVCKPIAPYHIAVIKEYTHMRTSAWIRNERISQFTCSLTFFNHIDTCVHSSFISIYIRMKWELYCYRSSNVKKRVEHHTRKMLLETLSEESNGDATAMERSRCNMEYDLF